MNVRAILQKFRYGSSKEITVVIVDKAGKERMLDKFEVLCPAMIKDGIGDEAFSSFAIKDKILKIYTK
jgi:hypothetical protein